MFLRDCCIRPLPVFHGLFILICTVGHTVVWYFKRKRCNWFYLLLRNRYFHTFTCVFEIKITFELQFSFRFGIHIHLIQELFIFLKMICLISCWSISSAWYYNLDYSVSDHTVLSWILCGQHKYQCLARWFCGHQEPLSKFKLSCGRGCIWLPSRPRGKREAWPHAVALFGSFGSSLRKS
jgi:hypothetical protein